MIVLEPYGSHFKPKYDFSFWSLLALIFAHFISSYIWFKEQAWTLFSASNFDSFCSVLYKNCTSIVSEDISGFQFIFILYALLSIGCLVLFLTRKMNIVNWLFIGLFIFKLFILVSRYNFVNSYHEMHMILCLVYFLCKGVSLPYRVVFCIQYFFSGLAKLSYTWFSGGTLLSLYGFNTDSFFYPLFLAYFAMFQVLLVWGLVFGNLFIKRMTTIQVLILNIALSYFVGIEYALLSLCFIAPIFVDDFFIHGGEGLFRGFFESYILKQVGAVALIAALIFNANIFSGKNEPYKTFALSRFIDINVKEEVKDCRFRVLEYKKNSGLEETVIKDLKNCKEASYQAYLRRLCAKSTESSKILFFVEEKVEAKQAYNKIEGYTDVCKNL